MEKVFIVIAVHVDISKRPTYRYRLSNLILRVESGGVDRIHSNPLSILFVYN